MDNNTELHPQIKTEDNIKLQNKTDPNSQPKKDKLKIEDKSELDDFMGRHRMPDIALLTFVVFTGRERFAVAPEEMDTFYKLLVEHSKEKPSWYVEARRQDLNNLTFDVDFKLSKLEQKMGPQLKKICLNTFIKVVAKAVAGKTFIHEPTDTNVVVMSTDDVMDVRGYMKSGMHIHTHIPVNVLEGLKFRLDTFLPALYEESDYEVEWENVIDEAVMYRNGIRLYLCQKEETNTVGRRYHLDEIIDFTDPTNDMARLKKAWLADPIELLRQTSLRYKIQEVVDRSEWCKAAHFPMNIRQFELGQKAGHEEKREKKDTSRQMLSVMCGKASEYIEKPVYSGISIGPRHTAQVKATCEVRDKFTKTVISGEAIHSKRRRAEAKAAAIVYQELIKREPYKTIHRKLKEERQRQRALEQQQLSDTGEVKRPLPQIAVDFTHKASTSDALKEFLKQFECDVNAWYPAETLLANYKTLLSILRNKTHVLQVDDSGSRARIMMLASVSQTESVLRLSTPHPYIPKPKAEWGIPTLAEAEAEAAAVQHAADLKREEERRQTMAPDADDFPEELV